MNIVLLTNFYPPEIRSISTMMRELADGLTAQEHRVTVITSYPRENLPEEALRQKFSERSLEQGVRVVRVNTPGARHVNYLLRGLAQLTMPYFFWRAIRRLHSASVDAVIVYTPHLPLTLVGEWVKKRFRARYVLNIQDIFPQNAIDLGILRNRVLIRLFERMEARAYRVADRLTTLTDGGRKFLIERKGIPKEKIHTVYNWIDPTPFVQARNTGRFRSRYKLNDKFVFLFPGIFGPSQDLDFLLEVARGVSDIPDIHLLFVGEGTEKNRIMAKATQGNLRNVQFEPFVSPSEYPELLKEVNVGLLCLSAKNKTAVVPGKLLGFMAASLPVLAFLQQESEGHGIIKNAQCGYSLVSNDSAAAVELMRKMFRERAGLAQLGRNGYNDVALHFSKKHCIGQIERLLT